MIGLMNRRALLGSVAAAPFALTGAALAAAKPDSRYRYVNDVVRAGIARMKREGVQEVVETSGGYYLSTRAGTYHSVRIPA